MVNKERKIRRNINRDIKIEEWIEYLKKVLGDRGESNEGYKGIEGRNRDGN